MTDQKEIKFRDRAFTYVRAATPIRRDGKNFFEWRRFRYGSKFSDETMLLPETMLGLLVAEAFAREAGLKVDPSGRIHHNQKALSICVEQVDGTTRVVDRPIGRPDRERLIGVFHPAYSVNYASGLEGLKLALQDMHEWPEDKPKAADRAGLGWSPSFADPI